MANDLWQKVKLQFLKTQMEDFQESDSKQQNVTSDPKKVRKQSTFDKSVEWSDFEKYFAKGMFI